MLTNRTMPHDVLIPVLGYPDVAEAVTWLCGAFGFTPRWQAGRHRAQVGVGPSAAIALVEDAPLAMSRNADHVMVRVDDVDAHHQRAVDYGATVTAEPTDHFFGERQYTVLDHIRRTWVFTQSIADVAPQEWGATVPELPDLPA